MLHDPQNYADPDKFAPERFLGTDNKDPEIDPSPLAFGFGRRVCPGREFAEATIYLCISMCLAVFNIEKPENRELKVKFMSKIVSSPMDFEVVIKPRSERSEALVRLIEDEHPLEKGSGEAIRDAISRIITQD